MGGDVKQCKKCGSQKPPVEFYSRPYNRNVCKVCYREYARENARAKARVRRKLPSPN